MPRPPKTWKNVEACFAKMFGTRRTPLSGSNSGHDTTSDSLHDRLYIEVKYRKEMATCTLFKDTEKKAKREGKIPMLGLKSRYGKPLIVCRPEDIQQIAKEMVE